MKKIAIPMSQGKVARHFGHCQVFHLFEVNDSKIENEESLTPPPHQPGVIPKWIHHQGATDVIAGGMGQRAIDIFNQLGINVYVGAPGKDSRTIIEAFLNGTLETHANLCDH
ncbi:MAG: NifB/NifX family molybdenum-iron cluster-binding protein [Bacteroidales bacterium]|nr:NifB/NifX family molybdenum-iron cluster-binding protein [Bacteroidales bacterium]